MPSPSEAPANQLNIYAISGLPEISPGAPLAQLLAAGARAEGFDLEDGDILAVAQKVVSKAEGRLIRLSGIEPSLFAQSLAQTFGKDPRHLEVVLRESKRIVRMDAGVIIVETRHGFTCANAGVDSSNVPPGWVSLLPEDPDASALRLQEEIASLTGHRVAVIICDTFGRPWREGLTNVAIGVAGFPPLTDYRGQTDVHGNRLSATVIAAADELAAAAELVMGKTARRPAAVIRHFAWQSAPGHASELIRPPEKDLFR